MLANKWMIESECEKTIFIIFSNSNTNDVIFYRGKNALITDNEIVLIHNLMVSIFLLCIPTNNLAYWHVLSIHLHWYYR